MKILDIYGIKSNYNKKCFTHKVTSFMEKTLYIGTAKYGKRR